MSIFNFIFSWNNFMTPMIVLLSQKNFTVPLLVMNLRGTFNRDFGATYCGIAMSSVPILIIYACMSRYITGGLSAGAVKG
jgi:multiple sugar transport system permease protein